jgi:uncharacterized protein
MVHFFSKPFFISMFILKMQVNRVSKIFARRFNVFLFSASRYPIAALIPITIVIDVFVTIVFSNLPLQSQSNGPLFNSKLEAFVLAIVIAPIFETLIFQHAVIKLIIKKSSNAKLLSCFVSAILFAASHYYSWAYVLKTFISGFLFSSLYLITMYKKQNPILVVLLAHAGYNLIGFVIDILTGSF